MIRLTSLILVLSFTFKLTFANDDVILEEQKLEQQKSQKEELPLSSQLWSDILLTGRLMLHGLYLQFAQKENLYILPGAIASNSWAFDNDKRIRRNFRSKSLPSIVDNIGDFGVVLNFPIAMGGVWYYSKHSNNSKLTSFAIEWAATTYLSLAESGLLSFIHIHERPDTENLSTWEKGFRGDSSYPSGHVIPYMALTWTTFHYYGPYWALIPFGFSLASSYQRVKDDKHWVSDIVGSFFFTAFASYGVKAQMKKEKTKSFLSKAIIEHDLNFSIVPAFDTWMPIVTFRY